MFGLFRKNYEEDDDFVYRKPWVICEIRDWIHRRDMKDVYSISNEAGYGMKRGVFIEINKENALNKGIYLRDEVTNMVFIETPMTRNGIDTSRVIDFLSFHGVRRDWFLKPEEQNLLLKYEDLEFEAIGKVEEHLKHPETLQEVVAWIKRAGKDNLFHIHEELYSVAESNVIYVSVKDAESNGLPPMDGTHAIQRLREEGMEMNNIIGFLVSFGVEPDWQ